MQRKPSYRRMRTYLAVIQKSGHLPVFLGDLTIPA